jgi:hypothetical protein
MVASGVSGKSPARPQLPCNLPSYSRMSNEERISDLLSLFSEYRNHARHLENHLLSFTQLFLVVTGALWGYALTRGRDSGSSLLGSSFRGENSSFGWLVFLFHLFYCLAGGLFVVRLSLNVRVNFDMANRVLGDAGLAAYTIIVPPHGPNGIIEINGVFRLLRLLLTAKAFFLLIYIGAAGVDTYFLASSIPNLRLCFLRIDPLFPAALVAVVFLAVAIWVYKQSAKVVGLSGSDFKKSRNNNS